MENVERFVIEPSIKLYGGIKVTADATFNTHTDNNEVHQTLKNFVLTTQVKRKFKVRNIECKENSKLEQILPEGTILIWGEDTGYIVPNYHMISAQTAMETFKVLSEVDNET